MIYSLDEALVFDPTDLDLDVTPETTRKAFRRCAREHSSRL